MFLVITGIHVTVCLLLVFVVLLQAGKGSGMGSIVAGSTQSFFDSNKTSGVLSKITTISAIIFMITSLTIGYMYNGRGNSILLNSEIELNQNDINKQEIETLEKKEE